MGKIVGICLKAKVEPKKKEEVFVAPEKNAFWEMAGYKSDLRIGKISNTPCIRGEYYWIYCEDFNMEYINGNFNT